MGGGGGMNPPLFFWVNNDKSFGFFAFEPKKCLWAPTPWVCIGRSGTSAHAVYAVFSQFCYVGGFGDVDDPVVPTPLVRGLVRG